MDHFQKFVHRLSGCLLWKVNQLCNKHLCPLGHTNDMYQVDTLFIWKNDEIAIKNGRVKDVSEIPQIPMSMVT